MTATRDDRSARQVPAFSYATKVGVSVGDGDRPAHVAVLREPSTGETLRTKGRLYILVEVAGRDGSAREAALEAAEVIRDEYYYDRSAGIEVSLRRAILQGNRRARMKLRGVDAGLHLACVVLCRSEAYAARVGAAEVFLVRRARLFVPGAFPGELTDYAYRGSTSPPPPFGSQSDLLVSVWREQIEMGDVLLLAGTRTVEELGAEPLKSAAVTLHPSAAARQLAERFHSQGGKGHEAVVVVEVAPRVAMRGEAVRMEEVEVEDLAERIRERIDAVWRRRPRVGGAIAATLGVFARPLAVVLAVVLAFLPRKVPPLPRAADVAALRAARRRRVTAVLSVVLVLISGAVLYLAYVDYQDAREIAVAAQAITRAEQRVAAARAAASKTPPDASAARIQLEAAEVALAEAERAPKADRRRMGELRATIAGLREKLTSVVADLAKADAKSRATSLDYNQNGLYVADAGATKLWRVLLEGDVRLLAQKGQEGLGTPSLIATFGDVVYALDDQGRLFRYEGDRRREVTLREKVAKEPVDMSFFATGPVPNLYVLDRATGQVWKYEPSADGQYALPPIAFLAQSLPPGSVRSLAVDQDVWVVTDEGQLLRFRRQGGAATASRLEFTVRWSGGTPRLSAVQARENQRNVYVLDAAARRVIQVSRDGRELERIALPAELPEPTAFVVIEEQSLVLSLHGTRIARTDFPR